MAFYNYSGCSKELEQITDQVSYNHRMAWVGRDIKDHLVPTPAIGPDTTR